MPNAARPDGFATLYRASHFGGRYPRDQQGPFGAPPSGLLTAACGLKDATQPRADAEQRCLSALAYVVSPPPAIRGMLPRYLPTISPQDAQPIPPIAAATPRPRPAWCQAGRVRHSQRHQSRRCQGAPRLLAELRCPLHAQRAGSCRQERSARRLRFHGHRLCPRRCRSDGRACQSSRPSWTRQRPMWSPTRPSRPQHCTELHSTNRIEGLNARPGPWT